MNIPGFSKISIDNPGILVSMDVIYIDVLGNAWISTGRHVGISMDIQGSMESKDARSLMAIKPSTNI